MAFDQIDIKHMETAIALAEKSAGLNHPNPLVGAVVAQGDKVLGTGTHLFENVEHAEPIALREAGDRAKGATIYVNLEPCSHVCRTPPCTDSIIAAGIKRVVYAIRDPDDRVNGRGDVILKTAGIKVDSGICAEKATELNRYYLKAKKTGLPWILIKVAMSLDGKIGLPDVKGEYFSSRKSLKFVHELRAVSDSIMVGAGTVRIDNPQLTCRLDTFDDIDMTVCDEMIYPKAAGRHNPVRIVLSKSLEMPLNSRIFKTGKARTVVISTTESDSQKIEKLKSLGVEIILLSGDDGKINLEQAFRGIYQMGIMNVMVEGGGNLIGSLLASNLVDELYLSVSPVLIGGENSPTWLETRIAETIREAPRLSRIKTFEVGDDILIRGRFSCSNR